jgi:hypothetical protein
MPKPVVIESPYAGETLLEIQANELYALRALEDALARNEAPFASHLLYPRVLDDKDPAERRQGIDGQLAWIDLAGAIVVYCDRGFSPGMIAAIRHCLRQGFEIVIRTIDSPPVLAAWVDEQLEAAIPIRELLDDVPLQGPAVRHIAARNGSNDREPSALESAGVKFVNPPPFAPTPPPAPQARPDGPASGWSSQEASR